MDLTWWDDFDREYWNDFVLHLERENLFAKDEETLEKLFSEREYVPSNGIGIMNVQSVERIHHLIEVVQQTCQVQRALLIFRTYSPEKTQPFFDEVHAYVLEKNRVKQTKKRTCHRSTVHCSCIFIRLLRFQIGNKQKMGGFSTCVNYQ